MSDIRSLTFQAGCVRHLVASCEKTCDPNILEGADQAIVTLKWLEKRADLLKELIRIDKSEPALAHIMRNFPDARITEIK